MHSGRDDVVLRKKGLLGGYVYVSQSPRTGGRSGGQGLIAVLLVAALVAALAGQAMWDRSEQKAKLLPKAESASKEASQRPASPDKGKRLVELIETVETAVNNYGK